MIRKVWKFFCSVKLTVVLFVLILIPSIIGTIILQNAPNPSQYVQTYGPTWDRLFRFLGFYDVYHDMRFVVLLVLLGLNTLACTINRFKLRWNRAGSMMTHFGLLFVLIGALIGSIWGVKGFMVISEGETTDQISVNRISQQTRTLPFKVKLVDFILDVDKEPENKLLVMNVASGRQDSYSFAPGQTIELPQSRWANVLGTVGIESKGAATASVEEVLPHAAMITSVSEGPEQTGMASMEFKITGADYQKQAYVVSQVERPYLSERAGIAIGYLALKDKAQVDGQLKQLLPSEKKTNEIEITLTGETGKKAYPAEAGSKYKVEGTSYFLEVLRYVPDFVILPSREVASRSEQPNNPAVQVRITGPDGFTQDQWLFSKFPSTHMGAEAPFEMRFKMNDGSSKPSRSLFVLNPENGEPVLALLKDGKLVEKQETAAGASFKIPDSPYVFSIERFIKNTNIVRKIENRPDMPSQAAVKIALKGSSEPYYLWEGTPVDVPGYKMLYKREDVIKDFFSVLQVLNDGHVVAEKKIEVNDPLRYGGYTLYQASYDTEHSSWSGLQVKKDPGVLFVYLGFSVMILGMIVIFYINPLLRRTKKQKSELIALG